MFKGEIPSLSTKRMNCETSRLNVGLLGMMFGGTIARVMKLAARDLGAILSSVTAK